jgi:hypothetical protein
MHHDPFAHLNLEQIKEAERTYPAQHPFLWRVAEFVRGPWAYAGREDAEEDGVWAGR